MAEIFLSYAREDAVKAELLANALEKQGWSVYWDRTSILPGQKLSEVIEQAVDQAKCVIVIWSTAAKQSNWVNGEASFGLEQNKLVQIHIENMQPPINFLGHHNENFCQWLGDVNDLGFKKLCLAVKGLVDEPSIFVNHPFEPEMVIIPAGSFQMGSNKYDREQPIHTVTIPKPFAMGKFPVTFEEYDYFAEQTGKNQPGDRGWGRKKRPVIYVSWEAARDYAVWISEQTGKRFRLPSEAEWEYTVRADSTSDFYWGDADEAKKFCWFNANSRNQTQLVGQKSPNAFGLYDMAGNVWEWCWDNWHENYQGAPADNSPWIDGGDTARHVLRGGSWYFEMIYLRSATRNVYSPDIRHSYIGFRVAQDLP